MRAFYSHRAPKQMIRAMHATRARLPNTSSTLPMLKPLPLLQSLPATRLGSCVQSDPSALWRATCGGCMCHPQRCNPKSPLPTPYAGRAPPPQQTQPVRCMLYWSAVVGRCGSVLRIVRHAAPRGPNGRVAMLQMLRGCTSLAWDERVVGV